MREAEAQSNSAITSTNANTGESNSATTNIARSVGSSSQRDHTKSSTQPPTSATGKSETSLVRVCSASVSILDTYEPTTTTTQSTAKRNSGR